MACYCSARFPSSIGTERPLYGTTVFSANSVARGEPLFSGMPVAVSVAYLCVAFCHSAEVQLAKRFCKVRLAKNFFRSVNFESGGHLYEACWVYDIRPYLVIANHRQRSKRRLQLEARLEVDLEVQVYSVAQILLAVLLPACSLLIRRYIAAKCPCKSGGARESKYAAALTCGSG